MLNGDMPLIGAARFGVRPAAPVRPTPQFQPAPASRPAPSWAPPAAPKAAPITQPGYLSATGKPLSVGQTVRGSDGSRNETVNSYFRGTILEFIPPTAEGNNVRVKRNSDGKVFRVKNKEIRAVL